MKRFIAVLALLLAAPSAWAVVGCTVYTRSSDGNDGDDGSTWALANATLVGSLADWTTTDVICVEDNHNETQTASMTLTPTGDTKLIPVPVFSVSDVDDSYSIGGSCQVSVTDTTSDITFSGHFSLFGLFACAADDMVFTNVSNDFMYLRDLSATLDGNNSRLTFGTQASRGISRWDGGTINFSDPAGGQIAHNRDGIVVFNGVTFAGGVAGPGLFISNSSNTGMTGYVVRGGDMSAYSGEIFADLSTIDAADFVLEILGTLLPASFTVDDGDWQNPRNYILISGSDDATGNESFRQDLYTFQGDVTTDTGVYHDNGLVYTEGNTNVSLKFEPTSHISKREVALCSVPRTAWISTTGPKTFTTEGIENFTTALDDAEVWQEVFYLGTTSSPEWSLDIGQVVGGTTALTAGTGLANWTAEPAGSRSFKLETTVTVNKIGLYQIHWCVAAFESAKVVHIDPKPTIS